MGKIQVNNFLLFQIILAERGRTHAHSIICRCLIEVALKDLEKKRLEYEKSPEKHPLYPDEWKIFWNRRYKELQQGLYHIVPPHGHKIIKENNETIPCLLDKRITMLIIFMLSFSIVDIY